MTKLIGIGIIAFLLFWLEQKIYQKIWQRKLSVKLRFAQDNLFEGEEGELAEVIENRKRLPLPMLKVKFQTSRSLQFADMESSKVTDQYYRNDVFQIGGGERIIRKLRFTAGKRGYYRINGIDLVASDLFLTSQMVESRETQQYLYVYPAPFSSQEFMQSLRQLSGEVLTKRHWLEDPFEYRGIREYQPYDEQKNINWKATAKTGELKVNQKSYTAMQNIRIFFNIEDNGILKKEEAVEAVFQIVTGLAECFLRQGMPVACYGNGRDILDGSWVELEPSAGKGQLERICRALARVDAARTVDFAEKLGGKLLEEGAGTMTILVAPNAYESFTRLVAEYLAKKQECVWFYPIWEKEEPDLPEPVKACVRVLPVRK